MKIVNFVQIHFSSKNMALTQTQEDSLMILSVATSAISFIAAVSTVITVFMGSKGLCRGLLRGTYYLYFK